MRAVLLLLVLGTMLAPARVQAQDLRFDTLYTRPVGPGVTHTYIEEPSMPWTIHVLEVDLTHPQLSIRSTKSGDRLRGGYERTSSMAARIDAPGHRVVGGVNADFYAGGAIPSGTQVLDGQILKKAHGSRPALGFDPEDRPMMEVVAVGGHVATADTTYALDGVNDSRATDHLILYNDLMGGTTQTNAFGTEVRVRPLGRWLANDTLRVVVEEVAAGVGGMAIPDGHAVLSGHGAAAAFLNDHVALGDTLRLFAGVLPGLPRVKELVGGGPFLVRNGVSDVGPRGDGGARHPRTGAGFSADSTRLFLITVDGRQNTSAGMTLPELAYFMTEIGVHTGMNLDGGGSTTMLVRGDVVNSPSDGTGERTVSNALLVVTSAPEGPLSRLFLTPERARLFMGGTTTFTTYGTDENYRPVPLDPAQITFSLDPGLGTLTDDGVFTAGSELDSGYVYLNYAGLRDSAFVVVKTVDRFDLTPATAFTDTSHVVPFFTRAYDQDGLFQDVPATAYTWTVSDPAVGSVDAQGRFRAHAPGTTDVVAQWRGLTQRATVTVDVTTGEAVLDGLDDADAWTLAGTQVDLTQTTLTPTTEAYVQGTGALRLDYAFTYDPSSLNEVHLEADLPIEGVPDSLYLDVRSDGRRHRVFFDVVDAQGNPFQLFAAAYADDADAFKRQPAAFARANPKGGSHNVYYPLRLQRIVVRLDSDKEAGARYTGTLYLDHLRLTYPAKAVDAEELGEAPRGIRLLPGYPNPFQAFTTVAYQLDAPQAVRLTLYDALGRAVATLEDGVRAPGRHEAVIDGRRLSAGLYFLRLEAGSAQRTTSLLRMK